MNITLQVISTIDCRPQLVNIPCTLDIQQTPNANKAVKITACETTATTTAKFKDNQIFMDIWSLTNALRRSTIIGPTDTIAAAGQIYLTNGGVYEVATCPEQKDEELHAEQLDETQYDVLE